MNTIINPYSNTQDAISLRLNHIIDTKVNFRYQFQNKDFSCGSEPMYAWMVNTRRLLGGIEDDPDRQFIKQQRRETSWIGETSRYWWTSTRYFVIGYAIDDCKVRSNKGIALDVAALIDIFTDKDAYAALIQRFTNDFFFQSGIDIHSKDLCRNKKAIEHKTLKTCFINGYRLCSDLYLALDQTRKMGPIRSYMELTKACEALGFDELPMWFIQESHDHGLNTQLSSDIEAQKHYALWAFVNEEGRSLLVSQNDPYGVEGTLAQTHVANKPVSMMLSSNPVKKPKKKREVTKKNTGGNPTEEVVIDTSSKPNTQAVAASAEIVDIETELNQEYGGLKPRKPFIPTETTEEKVEDYAHDTDNEDDEDIEIEVDDAPPALSEKARMLFNQFNT